MTVTYNARQLKDQVKLNIHVGKSDIIRNRDPDTELVLRGRAQRNLLIFKKGSMIYGEK